MIDTIFFDLDNTLLDFNKAERIAVTKTLIQLGIEPNEAIVKRYSELNLAQWKLLEQGKLNRNEVKVRRYQLLFRELGVKRSAEKAAKIYESQLAVGHYFIDGAEDILHTLWGHFRLYLMTNGTMHVQKSRMKSAGLEHYFQDIFISEEIGFNKPRKEYFDRCFERIPAFRKELAMIVGDSLTSDIQGGKNAGITTVWFNSFHIPNQSNIVPDYEIHHLKEMVPLIYSERTIPSFDRLPESDTETP